jgi:hypothetical protein
MLPRELLQEDSLQPFVEPKEVARKLHFERSYGVL